MAHKTITLQQMAQYAIDLQTCRELPWLLRSWAEFLPRIAELTGTTEAEACKHPISVLLSNRVREMSGDGSETERTRAFYAVRQLVGEKI